MQDLTYESNTNRTATVDQSNIGLDLAGNLEDQANLDRDYVFDDRGRVVTASLADVAKGTYRYDGIGQLTAKVQKPNTQDEFKRVFLYGQDGKLIFESVFNGNGTRVDKSYVWLNGVPIAYLKTRYFSNGNLWDEVLTYIHPDHLGTPRIGTEDDTSPVITWRWDSDAFGYGNDESDPDNDGNNVVFRLRFPGQHNDGSMKKFYNYFRTYDPKSGRYLESDPIGLDGGLNTYAYVSANPIGRIDPLGLDEYPDIWPGPLPSDGYYTHEMTVTLCGKVPPAPPWVSLDANIAFSNQMRSQYTDFFDRLYWFYRQVRGGGPWDFKQLGRKYEDFGNFHFGATGTATNIPNDLLRRGAGFASQRSDPTRVGLGDWFGNYPFGDDPKDQVQIDKGIQYCECMGY